MIRESGGRVRGGIGGREGGGDRAERTGFRGKGHSEELTKLRAQDEAVSECY
jgi:hypothetical protein